MNTNIVNIKKKMKVNKVFYKRGITKCKEEGY